MTGFGKKVIELPNKHITIEIKSLNSKQLDIYLRLPGYYREKEPEIRHLASSILERGKVEISLNIENTGASSNYYLNKPLINKYHSDLTALSEEMGEKQDQLLPVIIKLPDALKAEIDQVDEEEWQHILNAIKIALENLDQFRIDEGEMLEKDFRGRIKDIAKFHSEIHEFEDIRIETIKDRIKNKLNEIKDNIKIDKNRFEQELIYYLEKLDITEENVRLDKHCNYFIETLNAGGAIGRKLAFITQEIGREINTIGSKANDAEIQKRVILMKDELEKVKEQLFNIL
ncbi:YicC/YloC family endoribonuclease [Bacteroidota bacterium]